MEISLKNGGLIFSALKGVPNIYFFITVIVIAECCLYLYGDMHSNYPDIDMATAGSNYVITNVEKGSNAQKSGLKKGDIILTVQNEKINDYLLIPFPNQYKPASTINYEINRNGERKNISVKLQTDWSRNYRFFIFYYMLACVIILIGYFVLIKKPYEKTSRLFFIFTQIFAICLNSDLYINGEFGLYRTAIFVCTFPFLGPFVTHFFLYFPKRNKMLDKKYLLPLIYSFTALVSLFMIFATVKFYLNNNHSTDKLFTLSLKAGLLWMGITLSAAIILSIYNFFKIKELTAHNQLRWIMIGVLIGLLPETIFGFSMQPYINFDNIIPHSMDVLWAFGTIVLLLCITFAIFRYKLWDIEIIIRRSLLYFSLSLILASGYFLFYRLSGLIMEQNTYTSKFIGLFFSVILFIPSREILQKRIDEIFHREDYDPTSAALNFERKLIGKYETNDIMHNICAEIDNIFHFTSFAFLTGSELNNLVVKCALGKAKDLKGRNFILPEELNHLKNNIQTIAVSQLKKTPSFFKSINAEIITRVSYENNLTGYFICGPKLSERIYTRQDIELLNLLANRTAMFFQISTLYKARLERQTLLERERLRISKDMHDEVGSSLTKITLLSEIIRREIDSRVKTESNLDKISEISRSVIDNMNEIVWAINPKNDKLDNLAAYLREYIYEYLDGTGIYCQFDFMENFPPLNLTAEYRRNIFLVVKESFNNIVKHSSATAVNLKFVYDAPKLNITIKDNGKGFSIDNISKFGNGLNNMTKRIEEIGGKFIINSSPDKGVIIEITIGIT